jgi:aryl-alcohol dehydrogenase-like predicted oxidoreductase
MQHRPLGRSGLMVSELCLGTMTYGEQTDIDDAFAQMDLALESGIDFFDTAEMYAVPPRPETQGKTEEIIGAWLKARGSRGKVKIATKVCGRSDATWLRSEGQTCNLSRAQVIEACEKSLTRLGVETIDLYQVHWPDRAVSLFGSNDTIYVDRRGGPEVAIAETLAALTELVKAGKVREVGLSNENAWGTWTWLSLAASTGGARVQSIQNAYHLLNRTFEIGLAETAMREQLGLLAYSPLAQGYLTGKYRGGALPVGSRKQRFDRLQRYERPGAADAIEAYAALADEISVPLSTLALQFVTTRPFVASNIIGARTVEQLKGHIASLAMPWTAEIEARVNAIHQVRQNPCP